MDFLRLENYVSWALVSKQFRSKIINRTGSFSDKKQIF